MRKYLFWLIILGIGAITFLAAYFLSQTGEIPWEYAQNMQAEAPLGDAAGAETNTSFSLNFSGPVRASQIREFLTVEPAFDFEAHQGKSGNEVMVVPASPLEPGTLYRFILKTKAENIYFAFQTKAPLMLTGTFPENQATAVPLEASLNLVFNTVDPDFFMIWMGGRSLEISDVKIEPEIGWGGEWIGSSLSIMPESSWAPGTVYTVTYTPGGGQEGLNYRFQFETVSEKDGLQIEASASFRKEETPYFKLKGYSGNASGAILRAYSYRDIDAYAKALLDDLQGLPAWSNSAANSSLADSARLTPMYEAEVPLLPGSDGGYFVAGQNLPEGYYLLELELEGLLLEKNFQVSDLAVFLEANQEGDLFWVKDSGSGESPANGSIRDLRSGSSQTTDPEGVAFFPNPGAGDTVYQVMAGDKGLVLPLSRREQSGQGRYFYTDRTNYGSEDTLQFWGVSGEPLSEGGLWLSLKNAGGDILKEIPVSLNNPNKDSFQGLMELDGLLPGLYELVLQSENQLFKRELSVAPSKNTGELFLSGSKEAFSKGEELVYEVEVRGFEGLALSGLDLEYSLNGIAQGRLTTNDYGQAQIRISFMKYAGLLEDSGTLWLQVNTREGIDPYLEGNCRVKLVEDRLQAEAVLREDGLEIALAFWEDAGLKPLGEEKATVYLYALSYQKEGEGFTRREELLVKQELSSDREGLLKLEALPQAAGLIYGVVEAQNSRAGFYVYPWQEKARNLALRGNKQGFYAAGEEYSAAFASDTPLNGDYLFYTGGLYQGGGSAQFKGVLTPEDLPALAVKGVYFDGYSFQQADTLYLKGKQGLQAEISMVKEVYTSGEESFVQVCVRDDAGSPVAAMVHLRVASAADAREDSGFNYALSRLGSGQRIFSYLPESSGLSREILAGFQSYPTVEPVLFLETYSGEDGLAIFDFVIPQDSGEYTVDCLVYDDSQSFGQGRKEFEVEQGFTIKAESNREYLVGDQLTLYFQGEGSLAKGEIEYRAELKKPGGTENGESPSSITQAKALAGERVSLEIGAIIEGDYEITLRAYAGETGAEVTRTLSFSGVKDSFLQFNSESIAWELWQEPHLEIFEDEEAMEARLPEFIIISSSERSRVIKDLWWAAGTSGPDLDSHLGAENARMLLRDYAGDGLRDLISLEPSGFDYMLYQNSDGGLAYLPGQDSELELSVRALVLGSHNFDEGALKIYLRHALERGESLQSAALALAGLAALDEPVLNSILSYLEYNELEAAQELSLLWALCLSGDIQTAKSYYARLLESGIPNERECSLLSMLVASYLGQGENWAAFRNGLREVSKEESLGHDLSVFVISARNILPHLKNQEASFSYSYSGGGGREELQPASDFTLLLKAGEVLELSNFKGQAVVTRLFKDYPEGSSEGAILERDYEIPSHVSYGSEAGLMKITIDYSLPDYLAAGWYWVTDILPCGVRLFEVSWPEGGSLLKNPPVISTGGQKASFMLYKEAGQALEGSYTYYVKVVSAGLFSAPRAYISDEQGILGFDRARNVRIR